MLFNILLVFQIVVALGIVALVLIQHGKGADAGPALSGGSQGLLSASGGGSVLSKLTAILATLFIANSLALSALSGGSDNTLQGSVLSTEQPEQNKDVPQPE